jgi:hypothetical protein
VRPDGFQVHQPDTVIQRIAQQVQQAVAVKFVRPQGSEITFFRFPNWGSRAIVSTAESTSAAVLLWSFLYCLAKLGIPVDRDRSFRPIVTTHSGLS